MIDRQAVLQTLKCNPEQYPRTLDERFPHVLEKVIELWDTEDAEAYLADLLRPNVGRFDRDGFPDAAWEEILRLKILHNRQQPH
jgi:hypothetical protein